MPGPLLTFVDDSGADHLLIQDAITNLDLPVRSQHFVQVSEFLAALDRGEIRTDAVITDLNMPGPSGFDLLQCLRDRDVGRTLPVLIFSTSLSGADRARAEELDVAGYFVKPVSYEGLVEQLQEMVNLIVCWHHDSERQSHGFGPVRPTPGMEGAHPHGVSGTAS